MSVRLRAVMTRIQTMRTSTMVAIGILIGLLLIFYIKETEYKRRVALTARQMYKSKRLAAGGTDRATDIKEQTKHIIEVPAVNDRRKNDGDSQPATEETTTTTITTTTSRKYASSSTTTSFSDTEQEMEDILEQKMKNKLVQQNNVENTVANAGEIVDENNVNEHNAVTMSDVSRNTTLLSDDDDDEVIANAKAADILTDTRTGEHIEELHKTNERDNGFQTVGKSVSLVKEPHSFQMNLGQSQNNLPVNDNEVPKNIQMELNPNLNQFLNKAMTVKEAATPMVPASNVDTNLSEETMNIMKENVPQETQDKMQGQTSGSPELMKEQIQMLLRKYSGTLNETDLPRQNDTYTQRLRNKLIQTGRFDLMANENCKKRLPKCLIIGVMKAGTEAFSTFLGVHPQVAMQFGYAAMAFFSSPQFENGYEWYRERMMCSTRNQVTMEKSPQYFSSPLAPTRIYDMDPNMKLIILVRNPISRALSHFLQQKSSHPERLSGPTFEECVYNKETNTVIESSPYVQQSKYSVILRRWLKYFPYKQVLIVDGDTFKKNPTRSLSKTESFLDIDHSLSRDKLYFNEEKGFYCLKINSTVPEDLEMSCFGNEKGRPHPTIDPMVENALKKYFQPFNEEFMQITNMKMNW